MMNKIDIFRKNILGESKIINFKDAIQTSDSLKKLKNTVKKAFLYKASSLLAKKIEKIKENANHKEDNTVEINNKEFQVRLGGTKEGKLQFNLIETDDMRVVDSKTVLDNFDDDTTIDEILNGFILSSIREDTFQTSFGG